MVVLQETRGKTLDDGDLLVAVVERDDDLLYTKWNCWWGEDVTLKIHRLHILLQERHRSLQMWL